tara:strand:+ start:147050 stop:147454 length:405 start_codon:yes stop_codon:yes gene_type:complete
MEIKLKRKVVFEESSEELWGAYPWFQFLTKGEIKRYNDDCDVDVIIDSETNGESKDIPIEDLKALIQKAEDAGANFIQIDYHCDHEEYDVYGSLVTRATEGELQELVTKENEQKEKEKQARIKHLQEEIEQLKQ